MSVQLIIILLYFIITITIGLLSARRTKSADSFSGASLSVFAIVCASAGEWLGGTATTGVSKYGFNYGISGAWYTIANGIGVMFLAIFFARMFRSLNTGTVPGIIEKFFGAHARTVSSVALTIVMLAVGLSQMIAAGKLGQSLLGIDFKISCCVFAVIFIVYTLAGGMNAVASTNTMHLFIMYFGVIMGGILALHMAGGWSEFKSGIEALDSQTQGGGFLNMFSIGTSKVSSWIIASLLGACTAQAGLQPVLSSRNTHEARKACVITALVAAPFGLFTAFLGMTARVMSENGTLLDTAGNLVTDGKLALPTLMMNMNPIAGGIILASILAAVLSTASPIILAAGTMLTRDIYQNIIDPQADDIKILRVSRLTTAFSGVICCVGAILLVDASAILDLVYAAYSLRGAVFIVVLLGILWRRASEKGACIAIILTAVVAVGWVAWDLVFGSYPIVIGGFAVSETYAAVVTAFVSTIVFSLIFPKQEKTI